MKRTLALLIAVLMIVAMLPMATLITAAETTEPTFAVYKTDDSLVGTYTSLTDAEAALAAGYTLKVLQSYTVTAAHTWTKALNFTIEAADGVVIKHDGRKDADGKDISYVWTFSDKSADKQITLKNIKMESATGAITANFTSDFLKKDENKNRDNSGRIGLTFEGCDITAAATALSTTYAKISILDSKIVSGGTTLYATYAHVAIDGADTDLRSADNSVISAKYSAVEITNGVFCSTGTAGAISISDKSELEIHAGKFSSTGRAVVRVAAGSKDNSSNVHIYGGEFILNASASVESDDAVVSNSGYGNVYIDGGVFVNNNDASIGGVHSEYVLKHVSANGDFQISGAVMMATALQNGFYVPANSNSATGVAFPMVSIPIVKGVTPKYEYSIAQGETREFYYTTYGAGDLVIVPTVSSAPSVAVSEDGTKVDLVFTISLDEDLAAAIRTWARGKVNDAGVEYVTTDNYTVELGILLATEEAFLAANGVIANVAGATPSVTDITDNVAGAYSVSARVEGITAANKMQRYVAIPFIQLTIDGAVGDPQYGEFHIAAGVGSVADAAAAALRDNVNTPDEVYQHASIMPVAPGVENSPNLYPYMFNRFTAVQQQTLMGYLAHEHVLDYKGACSVTGCDANLSVSVDEGKAELFYTEDGDVNFFKLTLKKDIAYSIGFSSDAVDYQVYDPYGNLCTVVNGVFTAQAAVDEAQDGVPYIYYVRAEGKKTGGAQLVYSHVHEFEAYNEGCVIDGCDVVATPVAVEQDPAASQIVVKGNTYIFSVTLQAGVGYTVRVPNAAYSLATDGTYESFKIYDANGVEQTVTNNVLLCAADGTYYIEVKAAYTGKVTVEITHNHDYDHTGFCHYCEDDLGVVLSNVYQYSEEKRVFSGDLLFFAVRLQGGYTYRIATFNNQYVGTFEIYNAAGEKMALSGASFVCPEGGDGLYYLKVNVLNKVNAQLRLEVGHGTECTYNNKGVCEFEHVAYKLGKDDVPVMETVSCGKNDTIRLEDGTTKSASLKKEGGTAHFVLDYAAKNVDYKITIKGDVDYVIYKEDGQTALVEDDDYSVDENGVITYLNKEADAVLYLVLINNGESATTATVAVTHKHVINYRGRCDVLITTSGKAPYACSEKQLENIKPEVAVNVSYVANGVYHYAISLKKDVAYAITFTNAAATVKIVNASNEELVADEVTGAYTPDVASTYYVIVTATATTENEPATMLIGVYTAPEPPAQEPPAQEPPAV